MNYSMQHLIMRQIGNLLAGLLSTGRGKHYTTENLGLQGGNAGISAFPYSWAMASISTFTSLGSRATWTAERAG